jgi:hypothetical protein
MSKNKTAMGTRNRIGKVGTVRGVKIGKTQYSEKKL